MILGSLMTSRGHCVFANCRGSATAFAATEVFASAITEEQSPQKPPPCMDLDGRRELSADSEVVGGAERVYTAIVTILLAQPTWLLELLVRPAVLWLWQHLGDEGLGVPL